MASMNDKERFKQAVGCISLQLQRRLMPLAEQIGQTAMEIRLRINRPLCIVCTDNTYYVMKNGGLSNAPVSSEMLCISRVDISDTFHNICNYSVYMRQNEIVNGFITLKGGHRAGICGTAVCDNSKITNIRDISSINIRIARERKGCGKDLIRSVKRIDKGLLICGAPCSGKTTVLRDIARLLSTEYGKCVSLIDERGELAGTMSGIAQDDIGMCDVFDCYQKSDAINQAIRSMAPDIVVCDEIGSQRDFEALEHSLNCGVSIIATAHAADKYELRKRECIYKLARMGAFPNIVFLSDKNHPGKITSVAEAKDVFS